MRLVLRNEKDIEEIGEKIRLAREAQGMSQDDLADLMGTERVTVSRHESGTREMKIATFLQYADALNTDPALLFPDHVRTQENQSPKERLIEIIRRLPAEDPECYRIHKPEIHKDKVAKLLDDGEEIPGLKRVTMTSCFLK